MSKTIGLLTLVALGAAGCGPGLGAIDAPYLTVTTKGASVVDVGVGSSNQSECPQLGEDLQGTINGQPMTVLFRGGQVQADFFGTHCEGASLEGPGVGPGDVTIRVWDSSSTFEATFPALLDPRTLKLVSPADGHLYDGDRVQVTYAPVTDDFVPNGNDDVVDMGTEWGSAPAQRDGSFLTFTVHKPLYGDEGTSALGVANVISVPPSRCDGPQTCAAQPDIQPNTVPIVLMGAPRGANPTCSQCLCVCSDNSSQTVPLDPPSMSPTICSDVACPPACAPGLQRSFCSSRPAT